MIKKYRFDDTIYYQLKPLHELDNWHCWVAFGESCLFIYLAFLISYNLSWYFYPISLILIGSRQRALGTLLHEASHQTMARNKTINFILGTFFSGYLIFQSMSSYSRSHVQGHHSMFGDPEHDPDFKFALSEGLYQEHLTTQEFCWSYIISPLLLLKVPQYIRSILVSRLLDERNVLETLWMSLYWSMIIGLSITLNAWKELILFWILPYLTSFQIIGWFIEMSEHYPLMANKSPINMSRNRHSNVIEKFFTGMHNENFHLVHHLFPSIPFWNMVRAHTILMQDANYAQHDSNSGGILFSGNQAPSLLFRYGRKKIHTDDLISGGNR